jgi:hypothetical protein
MTALSAGFEAYLNSAVLHCILRGAKFQPIRNVYRSLKYRSLNYRSLRTMLIGHRLFEF